MAFSTNSLAQRQVVAQLPLLRFDSQDFQEEVLWCDVVIRRLNYEENVLQQ